MKKLLAFGAIIAGLFLISKKSSAKGNPSGSQTSNKVLPGNSNDLVITDHDYDWDYKRVSGVWYTKKKSSSDWIDMKKALSEANYKLAISRLENFLIKKNRKLNLSGWRK